MRTIWKATTIIFQWPITFLVILKITYYEQVTSSVFEDTKVRVEQILKEAFNNEQIDKNKLDAMNPKISNLQGFIVLIK